MEEEVVDGVARKAEFGKDEDGGTLVRRRVRRLQDGGGVGAGVGEDAADGAGADAGEAVPVERAERRVHAFSYSSICALISLSPAS